MGFLATFICLIWYTENHDRIRKELEEKAAAAKNHALSETDQAKLKDLEELGLIYNQFDSPEEMNTKPKYLKFIFMPLLISVFFLYLYLRCLVRRIRIHNQPQQQQGKGNNS